MESMPDWNEFKKMIKRQIDDYFGSKAKLIKLEIWEPEGTYKYTRKKPLRDKQRGMREL